MSQYLLSTYSVKREAQAEPEAPKPSMSPEEMEAMMAPIMALEAEMKESGAFVFTGRLHAPDAATVVRKSDGEVVMTDGPFVESKERIAGFYIINADDLDSALDWAGKVVDVINHPIEVQPFFEMPGA